MLFYFVWWVKRAINVVEIWLFHICLYFVTLYSWRCPVSTRNLSETVRPFLWVYLFGLWAIKMVMMLRNDVDDNFEWSVPLKDSDDRKENILETVIRRQHQKKTLLLFPHHLNSAFFCFLRFLSVFVSKCCWWYFRISHVNSTMNL